MIEKIIKYDRGVDGFHQTNLLRYKLFFFFLWKKKVTGKKGEREGMIANLKNKEKRQSYKESSINNQEPCSE